MPTRAKRDQFTAMISSTALDLPEHRAAVKEACIAARIFPIGMEHLPARDASGVAVSLEMVDQADIYLGIYAWRYGWVPDGKDISVTEMEFDRAGERKAAGELREILIFTAHKEHPCKVEDVEADKDAQQRLTAFKTKAATGRVRKEYRSVEELRRLVTEALHEFLRREYEKPLQTYFKALKDNFSTYENLGLPLPANAEGEKDVRIAIRELFVEPACTEARKSPEEFDAALGREENPAQPLLPLLAGEARRIVLLADPGMGKSTLIQWLITTLAEEAPLPAAAAGLRGAIPLPFILRDLVGHLPKDAKQWDWPALVRAFASYHPRAADRPPLAAALTGDEAYFRTLLASDRAFFLIDGLDEIGDPAHRRALRDALWQGFAQYPAARWLVTSRWVGYEEAKVHQRWFRGKGDAAGMRTSVNESAELSEFDAEMGADGGACAPRRNHTLMVVAKLLYLAPFDDLQQLTFARHWYLPRMGDVVGAEHAGRFVAAVRQNSAVRVIGRVPNLLYLLALLYRHRALLPHGRTHVYTAISEAYLGGLDLGIDAARGQIDAAKRLQAPDQHQDKVRLLATIARQMQERRAAQKEGERAGDILATRADLQEWLAPHFPADDDCAALHAFIGYVAARSGLLLPRGEGQFGFAHLSFQEYYAACWLEEEFRRLLNAQAGAGRSGFLRRAAAPEPAGALTTAGFAALAAQPAWREPLVFLVEKLSANADDTLTLIDWLFPQLGQPEPTAKNAEPTPELMPIHAGLLLAAFSLDPQVALTPEQREGIWGVLWRAHLARQDNFPGWFLAPALLAASEFQQEVWKTLIPFVKVMLDLTGCTGVADLAPLAGLSQLNLLCLNGCTGVVDLAPLADLTQLPRLYLAGCTGIEDLAPLASLSQLQELSLFGCTGLADLAPLAGLTQLQQLDLRGCTGLGAEAVAAFKKSHPQTRVVDPERRG